MTWETAGKRLAKSESAAGGIFVRLTGDGDKIVGVFCGEPYARDVVWTGERYEEYDPAVHSGEKPTLKVALNFFDTAEDVMKIIEGGARWFRDVLRVREKYGLDKWAFEVQRHGAPGDTKTTYSILPEEKIDDVLRAKLEAAEEHDLETVLSGGAAVKPQGSPAIPKHKAQAIADRLRAMPRAAVDAYMAKIGVQRLTELAEEDVPRALAILEQMETPPPKAKSAAVDPLDIF